MCERIEDDYGRKVDFDENPELGYERKVGFDKVHEVILYYVEMSYFVG